MSSKALTSFMAVFIAACFIAPFAGQIKDRVECVVTVTANPSHTCMPPGTPPCQEEDSPGPCYWDATTRGNGLGRSFWVDAQQRTHVTGR